MSSQSSRQPSANNQGAPSPSGANSQQSSKSDVEQHLKLVEGANRSDHKWIRCILKLLDNIYKLPGAQRGNHFRKFVRCLELSQQEQAGALKILKRDLDKNHDATKNRYIITKWLILLVYHAQNRAIKARNAVKTAEQVGKMASFCREGLHKLKCGHYRASHEECGMNCYGHSTFPDKPLTFDARMSEIVCFQCPY